MQFVETLAQREGLICFWINPSEARDVDSLWDLLLRRFLDALDAEGLLIAEVRRRHFWRSSTKLLPPIQQVASLNEYSKAFVGASKEALAQWLKPGGKQITALRNQLHARRIVVFVDDLDRADPRLVPSLLLGLREVLDLSGFCFVLGFDEEIVASSLTAANAAWKDGKAFLDKIIDFRFNLETPDSRSNFQLLAHHLRAVCPWMDLKVIEDNAEVLPSNPRLLKTLVRNLLSLSGLARRHNHDEFQWPDFFFGQIVKLESPTFLRQFLAVEGNAELIQTGIALGVAKTKSTSLEEKIETAVEPFVGKDDRLRKRLVAVLAAWHRRRGFSPLRHLRYYAEFGIHYPDLTWTELNSFMEEFRNTGRVDALEEAVSRQAEAHHTAPSDIFGQLLKLAMDDRQIQLSAVAEALTEIDMQEGLDAAEELLHVVGAILTKQPRAGALTSEAVQRTVEQLLAQSFRWIHFDADQYKVSRRQEESLLKQLIRLPLIAPKEWLEALLPFDDATSYITGGYQNAVALIRELRKDMDSDLIDAALKFLDRPDAYIGFFRPKARADHYLFFSSESPLWTADGVQRLRSHLSGAAYSRALHQNAMELFGYLTGHTRETYYQPAELKTILLLPDVAASLWAAGTSRVLNYRMQHSLLTYRAGALQTGVDAGDLPIPPWLTDRATQMGMSDQPE